MFLITDVVKTIRQQATGRVIAVVVGLTALYFLTRLINLNGLPIFTDEGIYVNWAKIAWHDAAWRFISLTDGKQPLQTWGTIPFLKLFPGDPLFAGRLFGVLSGFTALIGIAALSTYLWGRRAGVISALLYIFTPYFLFYDRMALVDSAVNSGFIWITFFSLLLVRYQRLDLAILLGFISGFTFLAKSSGFLFFALTVFTPLILLFTKQTKLTHKVGLLPSTINYYVLLACSFVIAFSMYTIQRLSPHFYLIAQKNKTFVLTPQELLKEPFQIFFTNVGEIPLNIVWEAGWLLPICSILGAVLLFQRNRSLFTYLLLLLVVPFIIICFFNKLNFPRYFIFFVSILVLFATYWFDTKFDRIKQISLLLLLGTYLFLNYFIVFDVARAKLPPIDRGQYIESENAGWGVKDLVHDVREESQTQPVVLVAEGDFGLIGDMLRVYLSPQDNITLKTYWPLTAEEIQKAKNETKIDEKIFVVTAHKDSIPNADLQLVSLYKKPVGTKAIYLFTPQD